jgi:quinol monooxygenase YgiN
VHPSGERACYHPAVPVHRREFLAQAGTAAIVPLGLRLSRTTATEDMTAMYGLIGKMTAVAGQRDALASMLVDSTGAMPGCLSYIVATDPADADALWITEVWDSAASHQASLKLPAVQATIAKARPIIAGFSNRVETVPIGGYGLGKTAGR